MTFSLSDDRQYLEKYYKATKEDYLERIGAQTPRTVDISVEEYEKYKTLEKKHEQLKKDYQKAINKLVKNDNELVHSKC